LALVVAAASFFRFYGHIRPVEQAMGWANAHVFIVTRSVRIPFSPYSTLRKNLAKSEMDRARLSEQLSQSQERTRRLEFTLGMKESNVHAEAGKKGVVAHVSAREPESWHATVIADRGLNSGVHKGFIALTGEGLAGRVIEVTQTSATVMLITGNGAATSGVAPARSVYGIAYGDGTGMIEMRSLPSSVRLQRGDLVVTSGYGGNYPAGLPIGRVSSFHIDHTELSPRVKVKPAADMANLYYLYLVAP